MSEFESIEEELKFMADCSDDRGDSETSLMFVRYLAHIRKLNAELAALKAGQGEAVAWMLADAVGGSMLEFQRDLLLESQHRYGGEIVPLYTAPPATGVIVPTELLKEAARIIDIYAPGGGSSEDFCLEELRALLAQSQGVKP